MLKQADLIINHKLFLCYDSIKYRDNISDPEITKLRGVVIECANRVEEILLQIPITFRQYTLHNLLHSFNVAERIYEFLPKDINGAIPLNALELTILWVSILLHDSGMAVSDRERAEIQGSEEYLSFISSRRYHGNNISNEKEPYTERLSEDALFAEFIRRRHAGRVRPVMKSYFSDLLFFRSKDIGEAVAVICESHGWNVAYSTIPNEPDRCVSKLPYESAVAGCVMNQQYLACCLRLGDILDFDDSRAPSIAMQYINFTEEFSMHEWEKHLGVDGIQVNEYLVTLFATCDNPQQFVDINMYLDWVNAELEQCIELTREKPFGTAERYALNLSPLVRRKISMRDSDYIAGGFRFELEYTEIINLLMDKALYPDSALFLRELLQNSLDACRLLSGLAKEKQSRYSPQIYVEDHSDESDDPRIIFQDNGIGMSEEIIRNYFLRVGKSYYRSNEFNAISDRLHKQKIQIDACSEFGIGFLSCFLGGDVIEVETYRLGFCPLHIRIEGAHKYFVIKRLKASENSFNPFYTGAAPEQDGPPNYPGTRITVHLKKDWREPYSEEEAQEIREEGIAALVLNNYAVNVDVPITVRYEDSRNNETKLFKIQPKCWEEQEPLLPGNMPEFWRKYLCPVRIPFESYEETRNVNGNACFWFLKGEDGKPALRRGFCTLNVNYGGITMIVFEPLISLVLTLKNLIQEKEVSLNRIINYCNLEDEQCEAAMKKLLEKVHISDIDDSLHHEFLLKKGMPELNEKNRKALIKALKGTYRFNNKFTEEDNSEAVIAAILDGDLEELFKLSMEREIRCYMEYRYLFEFAQYGIRLPDCWNRTYDSPIRATNIVALLDLYGDITMKPAANRLYVPYENTNCFRKLLGKIIYLVSLDLIRENSYGKDWMTWFSNIMDSNDELGTGFLEGWKTRVDHNVCNHLKFTYIINRERHKLTLHEVVEKAGNQVVLLDDYKEDKDGILFCNYDSILRALPKRKNANGVTEADISVLLPNER